MIDFIVVSYKLALQPWLDLVVGLFHYVIIESICRTSAAQSLDMHVRILPS